MEINTDSQLYKFCHRYMDELPDDLCQLFWKMLGEIVLLLFGGLLSGGIVILGLMGYAMWIVFGYVHGPFLTVMAIVLTALLGVVGVIVGFAWLDVYSKSVIPAVVKEGYRGIKEKYCPLIDWTHTREQD